MLREFHSMKQNWNESSCEFGNRCLQVGKTTFKDVPDEFRNASIISKYIDGLRNPDLQRELEIRSHTEKIDEMILFAEIYENAERKYGEKMQETKPAKLINQYLECKICQRKNHTTEDCHDLPKLLAMKMNISNENDKVQRPPRKTEVTCYKCGRKGHISTNCGKNDMVGAINEEQNEMILIENEKNELILNWTNEENFAIQFLVDSGCPETLIPVEIWEELNFPPLVKSKGTNLVSINGANLRSIGSCKLKNRTGKTLIAKIMENISRPILGRDSMKQLSISVNYEGAILNSQTALESTKRQTKLRTDDEESSEKEHKENEMDHTVKTVVEEYESVFAEKEFDIGTYEKIRHNIPLKEESTKNDRANKERQKKYYDGRKMTQNRTFNIGDRVTLQNNYRTKLQSRFHTKAVINKIYSSRLYGVEGSSKVFNICQIRKLEEPACLTLKEIRNRKNLIIETEVEESEEEIIYVPIIIEETDEPPNEDSRTSLNIVEHNDDMPVIDDGENSPTKFEETNVVIEAEVQEKDEDIEMIHSTPEIIEEVQEETEVLLETIEDKNEDEGNDKEEDEENEADEEHDEEENEEHDLEENEENEADEEENEEQDEEENEENEAGEEYEEQTEEAMERNKNALREINEDKSEDIIVDDLTPSTTRKKQYCVCNKERNVKFIKCENTDCTISWFHQRCSKLKGRKNVEFIIWLCSAECYDNFRKMGECSSKPIN
ncbi:hypothetical protein SNEBB_009443 [Seison nebaliae]|nr:hypothetical protein SNEBB_009443 [Seison nebaliae]